MACLKLGFRPRSAQGSSRIESVKSQSAKWISCFKDPMRRGKSSNKKLEKESVRGGEDLWASGSGTPRRFPEHLVIMVNGLVGRYLPVKFSRFCVLRDSCENIIDMNPKLSELKRMS